MSDEKILAKIQEILTDLSLDEKWWSKFREYIEQVCGDPSTDILVLVLKRKGKDKWILKSEVR